MAVLNGEIKPVVFPRQRSYNTLFVKIEASRRNVPRTVVTFASLNFLMIFPLYIIVHFLATQSNFLLEDAIVSLCQSLILSELHRVTQV